jgi:hypothetical protein
MDEHKSLAQHGFADYTPVPERAFVACRTAVGNETALAV